MCLFDCDNYNTLRGDTFKKIKAVDKIELDTGNKLQKLKILLSDRSLKSLNMLVKYINGIFEICTEREKESLSLYLYIFISLIQQISKCALNFLFTLK